LPCWGTDAAYLTIFRRKNYVQNSIKGNKHNNNNNNNNNNHESTTNSSSSNKSSAMNTSQAPLLCCVASDCNQEALYRCRLLRRLVYCSQDCLHRDRKHFEVELAVNMISLVDSSFSSSSSSSTSSNQQDKGMVDISVESKYFQKVQFAVTSTSKPPTASSSSASSSQRTSSEQIKMKKKKKKNKNKK
jgi:hypothetical protein